MNKENKLYSILDLFSGCGGLSLGLKKSSSRFKIVGAIDNDKKAIVSFKHNFPHVNRNMVLNEDIIEFSPREYETVLKSENLENPIIIAGGPPCPGFSTIGRSKILSLIKGGKWQHLSDAKHSFVDDPRNKLFFEFVKYVSYFKPAIFLLENVSGMSSCKFENGDLVLDVIKTEFEELDYNVKYSLINSADFGVPQERKRYFFVGTRNDYTSFEFRFPKPTHHRREIDVITENKKRKGLDKIPSLSEFIFDQNISKPRKSRVKPYVTSMQALLDLPLPTENEQKELIYRFTITDVINFFKEKYTSDILGHEESYPEMMKYLKWVRSKKPITCHESRKVNEKDKDIFPLLKSERFYSFKYGDLPDELKRYGNKGFQDKMRRIPWWKPSWTIVAHLQKDGYMFIHPDTDQNRSITVREAARIQSFPDNFDFSAGGEISRMHQYRLVGNAVPPLVAKAIGTEIIKWLDVNIS